MITMPSPILYAVDPHLGRLDYDSLSDQALMEMLVEHVERDDIDDIKDSNGNFTDVCEWDDVECKHGRVVRVDLSQRFFQKFKPFPFEFIPPGVKSLVLEDCCLYGTLDTSLLPQGISEEICLTDNDLFGSVDFQGLPRNLEFLILDQNKFGGSCTIADLPSTLLHFSIDNNEFSGEIVIDDLPSKIREVSVENNHLTGSIAINKLPQEMEFLSLAGNSFSGEFQLMEFPRNLRVINIASTKMSKAAVLRRATGKMDFTLYHDFIICVRDENGKKHNWERKIVKQKMDNYMSLSG